MGHVRCQLETVGAHALEMSHPILFLLGRGGGHAFYFNHNVAFNVLETNTFHYLEHFFPQRRG